MERNDYRNLPRTPEGLLLRSDLLAAGVPRKSIDAALRSGQLRRLQRAVYLPADKSVNPHLIASAVLHTVRPPATISHDTAARLQGLALAREPETEHATIPFRVRRPHRRLLTVHCHDLDTDEVVSIGGIRTTSPERTALDMLFHSDQLTALWVCEQAIRRDTVDLSHLRNAVAARAGTPNARRAIRLADTINPLSESPLETAARMVLLAGKLPPPSVQEPITDDSGRVIYRLDLAYPEHLLGIEMDGRAAHGGPGAVLADRRRQNYLVTKGWTILRFTWFDVTQRPAYVVATVRDALSQLKHAV